MYCPHLSESARAAIYLACARAAHEANRSYCMAIGDGTQPSWENAPEWQRSSAMNGVAGVLEQGNGPRALHDSWLREKRAAGWVFGPVKDPDAKVHPCMVDYDDLPSAQRAKDLVFVSVVVAVSKALERADLT